MTTDALLLCPYCKTGIAILARSDDPVDEFEPWVVMCTQCYDHEVLSRRWGKTRQAAIDNWNHWARRGGRPREIKLDNAGFEPISKEQRANNMAVNLFALECDRLKEGK